MSSHQFVGYWGYSNQEELNKLFTKVLGDREVKRFTQQNNDCFWGVAYIGFDKSCTEAGVGEELMAKRCLQDEIAISASGLSNVKDAWVRLQSECLVLGREPFGRMPLHWTQQGQVIWFASRLQLLLPVIETPQVSVSGLYGYSCFSYVPTPSRQLPTFLQCQLERN